MAVAGFRIHRSIQAAALLAAVWSFAAASSAQTVAPPRTTPRLSTGPSRAVEIDLDHILRGRVNGRGELVGMHHAPSAPKTMRAHGVECEVAFVPTSPGGANDVTTARVELRNPKSGRVELEKFSTLYPSAWDRDRITAAIREAYADALAGRGISDSGKWEGRTKSGVLIDGYMTRDGRRIATAYPVYRPRGGRR